MASFRSHARKNDVFDFNKGNDGSEQLPFTSDGRIDQNSPLKEGCSNSPDSSKSFDETQLELFHHRHGLLVLHLVATLMFVPSLAAWLQVWIYGLLIWISIPIHNLVFLDRFKVIYDFKRFGEWHKSIAKLKLTLIDHLVSESHSLYL